MQDFKKKLKKFINIICLKTRFHFIKMSNRSYLFRAKTVEAYTIKSLSEVLQNILTDVCFKFDKEGIKLLTVDNKKPPNSLIHLKMNGEAFDEFYCPNPLSVGINLQHFYKMLKSIKKKDNILLFISKNNPESLGITTIQADSGQPVTSHIKIQELSEIDVEIPDQYGHPIHIPTNTFQKMCKDMQSISSNIRIYSKASYLLFSCETLGMYDREVPFGEFDQDCEDEPYEDIFQTKNLSQLIKVSGLNSRMQVYAPPAMFHQQCAGDCDDLVYLLPLKICINTGHLGKLEIFIKSVSQIEREFVDEYQ